MCGLGQSGTEDEISALMPAERAPEHPVSLHPFESCLAKTSLVLWEVLILMNQCFPAKNVAFAISQPVLIESIQKMQTNKGANQTMAEGRKQAGHLQRAVLAQVSLLGQECGQINSSGLEAGTTMLCCGSSTLLQVTASPFGAEHV